MRRPPTSPDVWTRLSCDRTDGYNARPGIRTYEWCPFCGHPADDGDHDVLVTTSR